VTSLYIYRYRISDTALQLVAAPGWQGTMKVVALMIVLVAIYVGLHLVI
jgi:hypothetical protein